MVTISHLVKKELATRPFIEDGLGRNLISVGNLASELQGRIESELGKEVRLPAIIMAIRRHAETLKARGELEEMPSGRNLILRNGMIDIGVAKSPHLLRKIDRLHELLEYERGEMVNVIQGSHEVSIITVSRLKEKVLSILDSEKILNVMDDLCSLSISFSKEFLDTPGVIYRVVRELAWNSINIFELVSTNTELTFILSRKDSMRAYHLLEGLSEKNINSGGNGKP